MHRLWTIGNTMCGVSWDGIFRIFLQSEKYSWAKPGPLLQELIPPAQYPHICAAVYYHRMQSDFPGFHPPGRSQPLYLNHLFVIDVKAGDIIRIQGKLELSSLLIFKFPKPGKCSSSYPRNETTPSVCFSTFAGLRTAKSESLYSPVYNSNRFITFMQWISWAIPPFSNRFPCPDIAIMATLFGSTVASLSKTVHFPSESYDWGDLAIIKHSFLWGHHQIVFTGHIHFAHHPVKHDLIARSGFLHPCTADQWRSRAHPPSPLAPWQAEQYVLYNSSLDRFME